MKAAVSFAFLAAALQISETFGFQYDGLGRSWQEDSLLGTWNLRDLYGQYRKDSGPRHRDFDFLNDPLTNFRLQMLWSKLEKEKQRETRQDNDLDNSKINVETKSDVQSHDDIVLSENTVDFTVKEQSKEITGDPRIINSAKVKNVISPRETSKTLEEVATNETHSTEETLLSGNISISEETGIPSTGNSASTAEISNPEVSESAPTHNSTSSEEAIPSDNISTLQDLGTLPTNNATSTAEMLPSDTISTPEEPGTLPTNNATSTAEMLPSDTISTPEVPDILPSNSSTLIVEKLTSGDISTPGESDSSPRGTTIIFISDKISVDNSKNPITHISTTHFPASSEVTGTVSPTDLKSTTPHEHVISMPRIKTARIVVSSVFLAIGLIAIAVMAVWIFGRKYKALKYDQLKLLP